MAIIEIQEQTEAGVFWADEVRKLAAALAGQKTDAEVFAAAGLVCPNGCPERTGWTFFEEVSTSRAVWVGRVEDAEEADKGELAVIVETESKVFWECSENERFECDGCNYVVSANDVSHDWD